MKELILISWLFSAVGLFAKQGYLGVYYQDLSEPMKKALCVDYGVIVTRVVEDSPADSSGIKIGDIIFALDGEKIEDSNEFSCFIRTKPDEKIELTVLRAREEWKFKVQLGAKEPTKVKIHTKTGVELGGGGGPIVLWVQPNLAEINNKIEPVIGEGFDESLWLTGGGGYFSIWKKIRIGGVGGDGGKVKTGTKRSSELSLGYGGFLTEYVIPVGKWHFFFGSIIGGGGISLRVLRRRGLSWQEIWNNFHSDSVAGEVYEAVLECSFFHYQPYIGAQYPLTPWCSLNLRCGYFGTVLGEWEEMGIPISSAPEINLSNYCLSLGVIFGCFVH